MTTTVKDYANRRFDEGATADQVVAEVREKFPHIAGGWNYISGLKRAHGRPPVTRHVISALYCPDGRRYEWTAGDARAAELLTRMLVDRARAARGEWVDVETAQS